MDVADGTTSPLPLFARPPFILVLDMREARRAWVARLLAFAHYHAYVPPTPIEAYTWLEQHLVIPQAILLGDFDLSDQVFTQRIFQRFVIQQGQQIPVISLAHFAHQTAAGADQPFSSVSQDCIALLEVLWQEVPRWSA